MQYPLFLTIINVHYISGYNNNMISLISVIVGTYVIKIRTSINNENNNSKW